MEIVLIGLTAAFAAVLLGGFAINDYVLERRRVFRQLRTMEAYEIDPADVRKRELAAALALVGCRCRRIVSGVGVRSRRLRTFRMVAAVALGQRTALCVGTLTLDERTALRVRALALHRGARRRRLANARGLAEGLSTLRRRWKGWQRKRTN